MYGLNESSAPQLLLVKTSLDNLIDGAKLQQAREGKLQITDPVVFTQDDAGPRGVVTTSVIGGGGYAKKSTDDFSPKKSTFKAAAAPKLTVIAEFSSDLKIPRTFMSDQQQSAVAKSVTQDTKSMMATMERNGAYVYANGFTTQLTIDGATLFSNTHTNENGDTIDNLQTGTLGDDNLNILVNSLRTQVNQAGVKLGYEPDFLLGPSILDKTARSVTKSVLRAGSGNNDLNYWSEYYPGMKVWYSPFLDEVSTTAYFIGSAGHGVIRYDREAMSTTLVPWETDPNDMYTYKMRAREEVDSIEYSGLCGSNGTV